MPATRSATRSGKASIVEPAAPHWITSISSTDARRLHLIRWGWHLSQFLPFVLYYAGAVEAPTKFPASISFTQRQGWVIGLVALFWAPAWIAFLDLIRRNASARGVLAALACGVPGALTIFAFPIHSAPELHDLTALLYMMGHFYLLPVLGMKTPYRVGFGASLAAVFGLGFYAQAKFPEYGVTVEQKLLLGGPMLAPRSVRRSRRRSPPRSSPSSSRSWCASTSSSSSSCPASPRRSPSASCAELGSSGDNFRPHLQ